VNPIAKVITAEQVDGYRPSNSSHDVCLNDVLTLGRGGDIKIGVSVANTGISRVALSISPTSTGWKLTNTSRNGIMLHPWGLAPSRAGSTVQLRWPLIAVRVLSLEVSKRHWVLLECSQYREECAGSIATPGTTLSARRPKPLTDAETEALTTVFAGVTSWPPPLVPVEPLQLKQAAKHLGITASAVKFRLEGVRDKARALGLDHHASVTSPDYVHILVAAGYLLPPCIS
jgi:hypothetical protein